MIRSNLSRWDKIHIVAFFTGSTAQPPTDLQRSVKTDRQRSAKAVLKRPVKVNLQGSVKADLILSLMTKKWITYAAIVMNSFQMSKFLWLKILNYLSLFSRTTIVATPKRRLEIALEAKSRSPPVNPCRSFR